MFRVPFFGLIGIPLVLDLVLGSEKKDGYGTRLWVYVSLPKLLDSNFLSDQFSGTMTLQQINGHYPKRVMPPIFERLVINNKFGYFF